MCFLCLQEPSEAISCICCRILDYEKKKDERRLSLKGKFFAEHLVHVRQGSGGRDITENLNISTVNYTWLT